MTNEEYKLTDEEWREFQSIPEQWFSHRAWVDARIAERVAAIALEPEAREERKLSGILARAEEVRQDDGWCIGGAWGDYGEVVVPIRILSYVIEGELDQKIASTDPGFALTYAEQERRAEEAEAKLAEAREEAGPALRIDDDGAHIYWADPVEGCWVAFRRVDCVGEEELSERRLPAPEAREETVRVARVVHALASLAEEVIHSGDVAEVVAMPPGTTGLAAAVDARDSLYEEPAAWIRDQVENLHQILPAPEVTDAEVEAARAVITALAPYNMELRPDGSEDREAAAYVSGVQAASDAIPEALEAARKVK